MGMAPVKGDEKPEQPETKRTMVGMGAVSPDQIEADKKEKAAASAFATPAAEAAAEPEASKPEAAAKPKPKAAKPEPKPKAAKPEPKPEASEKDSKKRMVAAVPSEVSDNDESDESDDDDDDDDDFDTRPALYLAEFDTPGELMHAAEKVRDAGYQKWDCHTPYAIHGMDDAMGLAPTKIGIISFIAGMTGIVSALPADALHQQLGLPDHHRRQARRRLPADGTHHLRVGHPALRPVHALWPPRPRGSAPAQPPGFRERPFRGRQRRQVLHLHRGRGRVLRPREDQVPARVDAPEPPRTHRGDAVNTRLILLVALAAPCLLAGCRGQTSTEPQIVPIRNMYDQPRYDSQERSDFFQDGRSMRPPVEGTLAQEMEVDIEIATGRSADNSAWVLEVPTVVVERNGSLETVVRRGQERYDIYCAPCHGTSGDGHGMVRERIDAKPELGAGGLVPPTFHTDTLRQMPDGQLYATITNGIRNMPAYSHNVPLDDRWAIVTYVRALQLSQQHRAAEGANQ